jgi:alkanesulfonate monooxygenase SsuD/methylene tetrahydromethanopterin reductase-like flavin-dependent oxidoreductase (luciferase family)
VPEYHVIYSGTSEAPGAWAVAREDEGWHGVAVPDHLWVTGRPVPHMWITLAEMAAATRRARLGTSFANNLVRSPVEFAHAARTLQATSGGRVDAGLGAGWDEAEARALGVAFPPGGERSQRLAEALTVARALLHAGSCRFEGRWYQLDVPPIGPAVETPPRLVASATGRITMRRVIPHVDVLELQPPGFSVPGKGSMDPVAVAGTGLDDVRRSIGAARELRADVVLGTFLPFGCGSDPLVARIRGWLDGSPFARLFGEPDAVAEAIRDHASLGFERIQLGPVSPSSVAALAPVLLGT